MDSFIRDLLLCVCAIGLYEMGCRCYIRWRTRNDEYIFFGSLEEFEAELKKIKREARKQK
jgi:hypothetical protein